MPELNHRNYVLRGNTVMRRTPKLKGKTRVKAAKRARRYTDGRRVA